MKTLDFIFGSLLALSGAIGIVILDTDFINTINEFGGLSAWFAKNPFAGSSIAAAILFNIIFAIFSLVGILQMRGKEIF